MKKVKLSEVVQKRNHNLAFMQFVAAVLVILSHAHPLARGEKDILVRLTGGTLSLGVVAVGFFFLTGGFYIAKSMEQKKIAATFFKARILRIFPPLIFVVVCSVIMGSFLTEYTLSEYWTLAETWKYLGNGILVLQHNLPGVFLNNPYNSTVNGSLWTLPVEFLCYIACFFVYKMKLFSNKFWISAPFVFGAVVGYEILLDIPTLNAMVKPCLLFYIGMAFYIYRDKITLTALGNGIAVAAFLVLVILGWGDLAMIAAFPYVIMYMVFGMPQCGEKPAALGKYSYGIYLCAFPIQQCVAVYSDNPYVNLATAVLLATAGGVLIYKFIECPIMVWEKRKKA